MNDSKGRQEKEIKEKQKGGQRLRKRGLTAIVFGKLAGQQSAILSETTASSIRSRTGKQQQTTT